MTACCELNGFNCRKKARKRQNAKKKVKEKLFNPFWPLNGKCFSLVKHLTGKKSIS